ncbi:hypothetical protein AAOE16_05825 [Ekhidna sp. MALMAid0563]|uniref:hypothetical protein n=1 Tax=Ekhidna sp. MALMAid0563 TaxID=3143937 RepID=UPI0032E0395B
MKNIILISLTILFLLSCSTGNSNEQTTSEPVSQESSGSEVESSNKTSEKETPEPIEKPAVSYSNFLHHYILTAQDNTRGIYKIKFGDSSLVAERCTFIEGNYDCNEEVALELISTNDSISVFSLANIEGDTIPTWTFSNSGKKLTVFEYDEYLDAWYSMKYLAELEE